MRADADALLFAPIPVPGESLIGLVSRAANDNHHRTVAPILAAAGYPHHAHFDLAVSRSELLSNLARVLRVPESEVVDRSHPEVATPFRSVRVDLMGAPVMACDLDFRARRVSPRSLRTGAHHRAIWTHRLVPWCTETGGLLIERCPSCGARLGWHRAEGVAACDRCAVDLRGFEPGEADGDVREAVDPFVDLLSPDPDRHGPALARLSPGIREIGRGAAFELGWTLACAFGAPAGAAPRQRQAKLPAEARVATLVVASRSLATWPDCVEERLRALGDAGDAAGLDRLVRRLRSDFRPRRSWPELSSLAVRSLPDVFSWPVRARGVVHAYAPRLVGGTEAVRVLGTSTKKFSRLYRSGQVSQLVRGGGERNAFATYDAEDLAASGRAFRDRFRAVIAATRLGVTAHGLEQVIRLGGVEEILDRRVREVCPGRQVSRRSFDRLMADLRDAARDDKDLLVPIRSALAAIGGREKPYGPLLVAMRDRGIRFAMRDGDGPLLGRVLLSEADAAALADLRFGEADHPGFDFAETMTRVDAIDVLNINPPVMIQAIGRELAGMSAGGKLLRRDRVLALAAARISGGEVRHRWMIGRRRLPPALRPGGAIPRLGVTGWDRSAVEQLMEGEWI